MSRRSPQLCSALLLTLALAACGTQAPTTSTASSGISTGVPRAHPQAVEPAAGSQAAEPTVPQAPTGNPNAHAPSLAQVKRELIELNLCGGATSSAQAQPVASSTGPGFVADPGTIQNVGQLPALTTRLN